MIDFDLFRMNPFEFVESVHQRRSLSASEDGNLRPKFQKWLYIDAIDRWLQWRHQNELADNDRS